MSETSNLLTIIKADGEELAAEILFTHFSEEFEKSYVVFQIVGTDEVSAAVYRPDANEEQGILDDIETDEEWEMLDELLNNYYDAQESDELDLELDDEDDELEG